MSQYVILENEMIQVSFLCFTEGSQTEDKGQSEIFGVPCVAANTVPIDHGSDRAIVLLCTGKVILEIYDNDPKYYLYHDVPTRHFLTLGHNLNLY